MLESQALKLPLNKKYRIDRLNYKNFDAVPQWTETVSKFTLTIRNNDNSSCSSLGLFVSTHTEHMYCT